jgi:2-oxoglutarate ferredoxin oxidoreductase subunit alpha
MMRVGGMFVQMEDEIGSIAAIIGASAAGAKAFTATSGPGFSLMQENIATATIMEMPVVVVNVQRAGPCVGMATKPAQSDFMQLRWGRHGDQTLVALIPSTVTECFELAVESFNIAEELRIPVVLAPDEIVGHCRENFKAPEPGELLVSSRKKPTCPLDEYKPFSFAPGTVAPLAEFGSEYVSKLNCSTHDEKGFTSTDPDNGTRRVNQLYSKLENARKRIVKYKTFYVEDCDTLLIAFGGSARAARVVVEEMRAAGKKAGLFQIITAWPFPGPEIAACIHSGVKAIYIPEMNHDGQAADELKKYIPNPGILKRINKFNGLVLTPEDIYNSMD